jgi:ABC-type nitrate/sulfonate/bicarbonate transport system ATPase subunit
MVFQEATLLPWRTVEKNISFGLEIQKFGEEEIRKKVQEMLRIVGLLEFAKSYPHQLSVGMQQRVNFARALALEPDILLLDEPFSALDVETKNKLQIEFSRIIKEKNITSIFVTHTVDEAVCMANKVVLFSNGPATSEHIFYNVADVLNYKSNVSNFDDYAFD